MNPVSYIEDCYTIYIDEEKGTVVAKLDDRDFVNLLFGEVEHVHGKSGDVVDMSELACGVITNLLIQNEIQLVAKAKCNFAAGEIWDEDYGVELAVRRLTNQVLLLEKKFWANIKEKMFEICARAVRHVDAYERRIEHNRRRLNGLKH